MRIFQVGSLALFLIGCGVNPKLIYKCPDDGVCGDGKVCLAGYCENRPIGGDRGS
jgi:hypothetical protein